MHTCATLLAGLQIVRSRTLAHVGMSLRSKTLDLLFEYKAHYFEAERLGTMCINMCVLFFSENASSAFELFMH